MTLPLAEKVDIQAELKALHEILAKMNAVDNRKIDNAFSDIEDELTKSQPDKDEIGKALERALKYAEKADNFASSIEKFAPKIMKIAN